MSPPVLPVRPLSCSYENATFTSCLRRPLTPSPSRWGRRQVWRQPVDMDCAVYDSDSPCSACQRASDKQEYKALSCNSWGERISWHNWLRDHPHLGSTCLSISQPSEGGADRRPVDVLIPLWEGGQDAPLM